MSKRILFFILLSWLPAAAFPVFAQQKTDTTYTFRFVPQKDMFYVPWNGNDRELVRLLECIESNKPDIMNGRLPLRVDGYCKSLGSEAENLATAKIRSNRVKSELIVRTGIKEENFITNNHVSNGDFVTVCLTVPIEKTTSSDKNTEAKRKAETEAGRTAEERAARDRTEAERTATEQVGRGQVPAEEQVRVLVEEEFALSVPYTFALRANLLRWATLTPDLGVEWRINKEWSVLLNGTWTSWSWDDKNRRYAFWEISPEVRYHLGVEKRGYIGAMYHAGYFNYKLSGTGKQGSLMGGGLTGGYMLPLGRNFSLDFSIGAGCTHAEFDKYQVIDGVRVKKGKESKNYWGVNHLGVSLVWNLF